MWLDFNDNCQVQFNGNIVKFNKFTGKLLKSVNLNIEGISTKTIPCNLVPISQDNYIWNYEEANITYRELELNISGSHKVGGNILQDGDKRRKDLYLIFNLKSGSSKLWYKTWTVTWWGNSIRSDISADMTSTVNNILSALKNNDLGLIKINVGTVSVPDNSGKECQIGLSKTVGTDAESIIKNDLKKGWDFNNSYQQFLVIKLNNDILFVEIPNAKWTNNDAESKENIGNETITRFCKEVKCVKVNDLYSTEGGFWKMILGDAVIKDSTSVSIDGKLTFPNKLIIGNFNLLNKSNIPEGLYSSLDQYLFESMVLKSNKELVDIKADFSSTNNDELILRNSVEERNKLIETEYSYYAQDKKYASGFNYGTFYEASGDSFTNRNILINNLFNETVIMNQQGSESDKDFTLPDTALAQDWTYYLNNVVEPTIPSPVNLPITKKIVIDELGRIIVDDTNTPISEKSETFTGKSQTELSLTINWWSSRKDIVDIDSSTQNETGDILNAKVINTQYPEEVEVKLYPMVKIGKCQFSLEDCLNLIKRGIQVWV